MGCGVSCECVLVAAEVDKLIEKCNYQDVKGHRKSIISHDWKGFNPQDLKADLYEAFVVCAS